MVTNGTQRRLYSPLGRSWRRSSVATKHSFTAFQSARVPNLYKWGIFIRDSHQSSAIMQRKSFLHQFQRRQSRPQYESQRRNQSRIDSIVRWFSRVFRSCRKEPELQDFMPFLPHTFVTSNLGTQDEVFQLYFSHFLTGDPSIAVFSSSQYAAPTEWQPHRVNMRHGCRPNHLNVRQVCTVSVIVGLGCQHDVSMTSIHHWDPAWGGMLLVDWEAMYEDYFARERMKKNKERALKIMKGYRWKRDRT
jgi:hypothetical protein